MSPNVPPAFQLVPSVDKDIFGYGEFGQTAVGASRQLPPVPPRLLRFRHDDQEIHIRTGAVRACGMGAEQDHLVRLHLGDDPIRHRL